MKPPHACTGEELSEEEEWGGAERWRIMWPLSVFDTICCGLIRSACSDTGGVLKTLLLFFSLFFSPNVPPCSLVAPASLLLPQIRVSLQPPVEN